MYCRGPGRFGPVRGYFQSAEASAPEYSRVFEKIGRCPRETSDPEKEHYHEQKQPNAP